MSEIRVRLDLACDGDDGHRTRLNVQSTNVLEGLGTEAGRSWVPVIGGPQNVKPAVEV